MRFGELVATSERVAGTAGRRDKVAILAGLLAALAPAEVEAAVGFLVGWPRQGRVGVGWAGFRQALADLPPAPTESTIDIHDVDRFLTQVGATSGRGSAAARATMIRDLMAGATDAERRFLVALATGEVRQGALEAVVLEAVGRAAGVPLDRLERAAMLAGDLGQVA
ncbi:MAG: ATP-dependent DNA ligase, partial [Gemmatimonadetes bacterium]|nr:ATP-dependent DNA ligase [Gemmatimonadota bacterium]